MPVYKTTRGINFTKEGAEKETFVAAGVTVDLKEGELVEKLLAKGSIVPVDTTEPVKIDQPTADQIAQDLEVAE